MIQSLRISVMLLLMMTLLTGAIYPAVVTAVSQILFPHQAQGSLIRQGDVVMGSELIGQSFSDPKYFWGRLSATSPLPYNAAASSGSNLGPMNPALQTAIQSRVDALRQFPTPEEAVPVDLVTASGSGLDGEISPAAAEFQVPRIASARKMSEDNVHALIRQLTVGRQLGVLGEPRINVLQLNLTLDREDAVTTIQLNEGKRIP